MAFCQLVSQLRLVSNIFYKYTRQLLKNVIKNEERYDDFKQGIAGNSIDGA